MGKKAATVEDGEVSTKYPDLLHEEEDNEHRKSSFYEKDEVEIKAQSQSSTGKDGEAQNKETLLKETGPCVHVSLKDVSCLKDKPSSEATDVAGNDGNVTQKETKSKK